jgi:hypothetical protein
MMRFAEWLRLLLDYRPGDDYMGKFLELEAFSVESVKKYSPHRGGGSAIIGTK